MANNILYITYCDAFNSAIKEKEYIIKIYKFRDPEFNKSIMIWHHKSPIAFNLFLVLVQCFHGLWISLTCHNNKWSRKP